MPLRGIEMNVILIFFNMVISFCISKFLFGLGVDGITLVMLFSNSVMLASMINNNN